MPPDWPSSVPRWEVIFKCGRRMELVTPMYAMYCTYSLTTSAFYMINRNGGSYGGIRRSINAPREGRVLPASCQRHSWSNWLQTLRPSAIQSSFSLRFWAATLWTLYEGHTYNSSLAFLAPFEIISVVEMLPSGPTFSLSVCYINVSSDIGSRLCFNSRVPWNFLILSQLFWPEWCSVSHSMRLSKPMFQLYEFFPAFVVWVHLFQAEVGF